MTNSTETESATSDSVWEETKANVIAASDYTVEKTKEGYSYAQDGLKDGLKSVSSTIVSTADSLEKKEPTDWEQAKASVFDAVEAVKQSGQEPWGSIVTSVSTSKKEDKESLWEETKDSVAAASDYTAEKTKEGYTYAQEKSQTAVDAITGSVHDGLKIVSENIGAAAGGLEKKEPTAWEQTKTGVSNAVDAVTQGVQEGWESLTAESKAADSDKK